jgi:protein SCO1
MRFVRTRQNSSREKYRENGIPSLRLSPRKRGERGKKRAYALNLFAMLSLFCLSCLLFCGCGKKETTSGTQTFVVKGVVIRLEPDGKTIVINHEAIPNYMPAMTMSFEVRDTNELRGLNPGDPITFHMVVTPEHGWVEDITKVAGAGQTEGSAGASPYQADSNTAGASPYQAVTNGGISMTRALQPLDEGDLLPDYTFTNELGQTVRLSQFKGSVLALTFFFTSCPFPDYCPRLTGNFEKAEKKLSEMTNAPSNWHLLSISFDPATDTSSHLKTFANMVHYDPSHWSFLTGDETQIGGLADQLGENYWREGTSIGHNMRTVVVDPKGRIRKIFPGNKWTVDELINEMVSASR